MDAQRRLKLALIGLGRLGAIRARILAFQQPRIELVAACDNKPGANEWAVANLPSSVKFYADPEDCMRNSGAEAILISTATATHAPLICLDDDSYRAAKLMVENGTLGNIHAVETTCLDQQDPTGFFVTFSAQSGGIFVDMGIDIGRYFLDVKSGLKNPKKQVNRVIAMGQQAVYGDLAKYGDCDNGWGLVEFANGKVLTTHLGRTLTNGFEGMTRVCGTKGHSVINGNSTINRVEIRDSYGVRTATTPDAFVLYDKSFLNDLAEFADCVLENKPLTCTPEDAYEAAKIANALQYSFRKGVPVFFDDDGLPIMEVDSTETP
ncbi:hypothetical protein N0V90_007897 [Kalmusia sp. IMI 367209]|nr:hypothetical protein N0V90_007897 [Kalmusia sp. IMI 367209]